MLIRTIILYLNYPDNVIIAGNPAKVVKENEE